MNHLPKLPLAFRLALPLLLIAVAQVPDAAATHIASVDPSPPVHSSGTETYIYLPLVLNNASNAPLTIDITPDEGGSGGTADGTLAVDVPPGAVDESVTLTIEPTDEPPPDPVSDFRRMYAINARTAGGELVSTFDQPVALKLSYADLDLRYVDESTLTIYHQEADGSWTPLSTTLDTGAGVARTTTTQFSNFGLFADAVTDPNSSAWLPSSVVLDDDGSLYAIDLDFQLSRLAPGSTTVTAYFDFGWGSGHPNDSITLDGVDLTIDQDTNTLYFTDNGYRIYAVDSALAETVFYDDYAYALDFDQTNDVLYLADDSAVRLLDAGTGAGVNSYLLPTYGERVQDIAVDDTGGVYVITTRAADPSLPHWQFWGTLYYYDPTYDTWWTIASGFAHPYRLDVDSADNVYVTNLSGDAISVVSGGRREVTGFMATTVGQGAVLVDGDRLLASSDVGGLRTLPGSRRDGLSGQLTTSVTPGDTLSGRDNTLTLQTSLQSDIAAHNFLQVNGRTALTPIAIEEGTLTYRLPKPVWYGDPYWDGGDTYRFCVGDKCSSGPMAPMPELGNWEFVPNMMMDQTLTVAQGEWLVWQGGFETDQLVSDQGLFPNWQAPADAATGWLAYRFEQLGTYTFTVTDRGGTSYTQTVNVTRMGRPGGRNQGFTVYPREGAKIYNQGAILEIPPGALPGSDSYDVTFANDGESDQPPFQGSYSARSRGYYAIYNPEPTHLNAAITMRIPYDAAGVTAPPQAAVYSPSVDDLLNLASTTTDDDYVVLTYPAGDYATSDSPDPLAAAGAQIAATANDGIGYHVRGALNAVSDGIYWATGLPNSMVGDANFAVIYHTGDGVSDTYAGTLYSALDQARTSYRNLGYTMPDEQIVVKIAPWATKVTNAEGFVPKQSLFGYYTMFVNDQLNTTDLKTTAAHELFHIAQSESGSWSGWMPKWWTEGTAVWAEYNEYPDSPSYRGRIEYGGDFVHVPYRDWSSSLTTDQCYGSVAFAIYLDERHSNSALSVFTGVDDSTDVYDAIQAVVGDEVAFYESFAKAYWRQAYATASSWDVYKFVPEHHFTTYKHRVVVNTGDSLSSFMDNWFYDGSTTPPSYDQASGTAMRVASSCQGRSLYVLDGNKQETGIEVIDQQVSPNGGYDLAPLGTYDRQNQLYFLVVNKEVADPACALEVWFEIPTIESVSPTSVQAGQTTQVTITGGGFGPVEGRVANATVVAGGWGENQVTVEVSPSAAGELELVVHHDVGDVGSNPVTLTVVE